jgi:hypothetical protein
LTLDLLFHIGQVFRDTHDLPLLVKSESGGVKMSEKKAFVFDTNFIIEYKDVLRSIVENLSEQFSVYVTQVSIDERISQKCLELRKKYDRVEQLKNDYRGIAVIKIVKTLDDRIKDEHTLTQNGYTVLFKERIIPFLRDAKTFDVMLNRVYEKKPPFSSVDGASDKGFKDSLIWLSLLNYFTKQGEDHVIFVTNDKGFGNQEADLCAEFKETTCKKIEIYDNSYYRTILKPSTMEQVKETQTMPVMLPDFCALREEIHTVVSALCDLETEDGWGNPNRERTFTNNKKFDANSMREIFSGLQRKIETHIFDQSIPADSIFALDDRISNGLVNVPIAALENAQKLYNAISKKYPEYIEQFYTTASNILNQNYLEPAIDDDELLF